MLEIHVVMPVFNEGDGIEEFINEIFDSLSYYKPTLIVVDDCSTDNTSDVLAKIAANNSKLLVDRNPENVGHGQSTVRALREGMKCNAHTILAVDGDGQFRSQQISELLAAHFQNKNELTIGKRINRNEAFFRKISTFATRLLVYIKTGIYPEDANSPLRIYTSKTLESLLAEIPSRTSVPNIWGTIWLLKNRIKYEYIPIEFIPRRGDSKISVSWGKAIFSILPSRRFLKFCLAALNEFTKTKI